MHSYLEICKNPGHSLRTRCELFIFVTLKIIDLYISQRKILYDVQRFIHLAAP